MRKIPPYAAHVPFHRLVSIACVGRCNGARRWAELVVPSTPVPLHSGAFAGYAARCLVCGQLAVDPSTWVAP